jgi:cell wall-associated NlpC family hydrolase
MQTIKRIINILLIAIFIYLLTLFGISGYISWKASQDRLDIAPNLITSYALMYLPDDKLIARGNHMDCSSFAASVYRKFGISMPRSAKQQFKNFLIQTKEPMPADLVFFVSTKNTISHVGIVLSDSSFIHSPGKDKPVRIDYLDNPYWKHKYYGTKCVLCEVDKN